MDTEPEHFIYTVTNLLYLVYMEAVEFNAIAENGIISIPEKYRGVASGAVHVIVLKKEQPPVRDYDAQFHKIQKEFTDDSSAASKTDLMEFSGKIDWPIDDPIEWQRKIREEWDR